MSSPRVEDFLATILAATRSSYPRGVRKQTRFRFPTIFRIDSSQSSL